MDYNVKLLNIVSNFSDKQVIVAGDIMLDCYEWADRIRDSKEDLCFIGINPKLEYCPGGAGNVFANIASLGGQPHICSVIGKDHNGEILKNELNSKLSRKSINGEFDCLTDLCERPTTFKRRTCFQIPDKHGYRQVGRVDFEVTTNVYP